MKMITKRSYHREAVVAQLVSNPMSHRESLDWISESAALFGLYGLPFHVCQQALLPYVQTHFSLLWALFPYYHGSRPQLVDEKRHGEGGKLHVIW